MNINLDLQNVCSDQDAPTFEQFQTWVNLAVSDKQGDSSLCLRLVDEDESQKLNLAFRQKNYPTNILSFEYDIPDVIDPENKTLGDIVLCASIIRAEALEHRVPLHDHWAHLVIHGVLHLLGYDHKIESDAQSMEKKEIALLAQINIDNPYH